MEENNNLGLRLAIRETLVLNGIVQYHTIIENGYTLFRLKKEIGLLNTTMIVATMITKLCGAFNVSKNMTIEQIQDFALTLVEDNLHGSYDYPSLRIEDLAVFFELAKTGKFGRPFDYVDGGLIIEWLNKYFVERDERWHNWIAYEKHNQPDTKISSEESTMTNEERKKIIDEMVGKIQKSKEEMDAQADNDKEGQERRRLERIERQRRAIFKSDEEYEMYKEEYEQYLKDKEETEKKEHERKLQNKEV